DRLRQRQGGQRGGGRRDRRCHRSGGHAKLDRQQFAAVAAGAHADREEVSVYRSLVRRLTSMGVSRPKIRPKVVASKQLTKATVVGRTLAVSQVMFMLVSLFRCGRGLPRVEHRDEMRTKEGGVSRSRGTRRAPRHRAGRWARPCPPDPWPSLPCVAATPAYGSISTPGF